jgi:vacuolar-type H+-ATPase subunit B/Vma2
MNGAGGRLRRVNGPLVECGGITDPAIADLVALGEREVWGEVVSVAGDRVTVQAYEDTGGLVPGDPARSLHRPMSARLGPGLLGQVFDGLLRPLSAAPTFLTGERGQQITPRAARFERCVHPGDQVVPGTVLGVLRTDGPLEHRVVVPPGVSGTVDSVVRDGEQPGDATVASVGGTPVGVEEYWPVRRPRPSAVRLDAGAPLRTGQRVLDLMFPVVLGGSAVVPGGFGTGKTMLLQQVAKWCDADVIVYVGCGERGNEMAEIVAEFGELDDPRTPRIALTVAEELAFTGGRHVLVVMGDMTSYAEALREVSAARGEAPARRAYPGYLYSDLATLYERCGRIRGWPGSVTVLPFLTMPAGDITHPVPDLTGYITEGQIVLSPEVHARGVYPPVDALSSLSRLMSHGAGPGRTRADHLDVPAQLMAALSRARRVGSLAELVGAAALSDGDRGYLDLEAAFERDLAAQRPTERRTLDDTLDRAWRVLLRLPRSELGMLPAALLAAHPGPG